MEHPVTITGRQIRLTPDIRDAIRSRAMWLERFHHKIQHVDVVVEGPSRHQRRGGHFEIHIDLQVPGAVLAVSRISGDELDTVIHHAFDAARRRLQDHLQRRRGDIKHRATGASTTVAQPADQDAVGEWPVVEEVS